MEDTRYITVALTIHQTLLKPLTAFNIFILRNTKVIQMKTGKTNNEH
jgi:hypothetical protein